MGNEKVTQKSEPSWNGLEEFFATQVIEQAKVAAKRWFIAWLITLAALVGTNAAWIYVFNSYEYVTQDGEGYNYYNSEIDGDVENGTEN